MSTKKQSTPQFAGYAVEIRVMRYSRKPKTDHADFTELSKVYIGSFAKSEKLAIQKYRVIKEHALKLTDERTKAERGQ